MRYSSIRAYKIGLYINSFISRVESLIKHGKKKNKDSDLERLDSVLHYPLKTALIPIVNIDLLMEKQKEKIRLIERDIGLVYEGDGYTFINLVDSTLRTFISYCHLIPASEMDHHQYIGGLLEHSLDVSIKALQNSMSYMLDELGLIDEDQARRPRYEYAAWVCGLLHDAGKIISNVQVIGSNGEIWYPLNETIFEWADRNQISEYSVIHRKERLNNDHETNSVHFMPLVLNDLAKSYLIGSHDDLYSLMTQTLIHYHSYKGYLFNAVRKADSDSTYEDYARVWLHDSSRKKSITLGVVNAMRLLYTSWVVNKPGGDIFVFNNQIYIAADKPINEVIQKCVEYKIKLPTSSKALISILLDKRILSMVSSKSTYAYLYLGDFTPEDIEAFDKDKTGPLSTVQPNTVIKVEWPNFVIGDNPIPNNANGALRFNTSKQKNVHQLRNNEGTFMVIPKETNTDPFSADITQSAAKAEQSDLQKTANNGTSSTIKPVKTTKKVKAKEIAIEAVLQNSLVATEATNKAISNELPDRTSKKTKSPKPTKKVKPAVKTNDKDKSLSTNQLVQEQELPSQAAINFEEKDAVASTESLDSQTELSPFPWITNKRRPKAIDYALSDLMNSQNSNDIWLEKSDICVNTEYLIQHTQQNLAQLLNALNFLKLSKKNSQSKDVSVKNQNSTKVVYIHLSSDVAAHFKIHPVECDTHVVDKSIDTIKQELNSEDDIKLIPYSDLITQLQKCAPEMKRKQILAFCKSNDVVPIVSDTGDVNVQITDVITDELKWKLRANNE